MPTSAPKRPRAARLRPEERSAQLVQAAIRVFAQRGLGGSRPVDVAREAGVSEATVYVYFPSREDLVRAVLAEVGRFFLELNGRVLEAEDEPLPVLLRGLVEGYARSLDEAPDYTRVWLNWSSAMRDDLWPRFVEIESQIVDQIAQSIALHEETDDAHRVPADHRARTLIGAAEMIARVKFAGGSPAEVDGFVESVLAMLTPGAAAAPSGR